MQPRDFVYWLQGYFEISNSTSLTAREVLTIKNHLNLVFAHAIDNQYPAETKEKLADIHRGARSPVNDSLRKVPPGVEVMC